MWSGCKKLLTRSSWREPVVKNVRRLLAPNERSPSGMAAGSAKRPAAILNAAELPKIFLSF